MHSRIFRARVLQVLVLENPEFAQLFPQPSVAEIEQTEFL